MFIVPTLEESHALLVALTKALFPTIDVSPKSFPALFTKTMAAAATDNHAHIVSALADLLPDTAGDDGPIDRWGSIVGRPRKGATPARKSDALRLVNNTASDVVVSGSPTLTHVSGLRFQISAGLTVPANGTADANLVAVDTGSATRLAAGEDLTFDATPSGLEEVARLVLDLDEDGVDREDVGAYRNRVLARFRTPPLGGAQADYVTWSLEVIGIAAAYCYPNRAGLGTVDVAALHAGTGTARILSSPERDELLAYLNTRRPVSAAVRVLEVAPQVVSVEVALVDTGEEFTAWDWIDEVPLTVSAWNSGTRTLTFSSDRPDSLQAGGRVVVRPVSGLGTGEPYVVESLVSTNAVVLEQAPSVAPVSGDPVYSGGGLTDSVRAAITAHFATLGTANPDTASYGGWEGNLRLAAINQVVIGVPGVRDLEVVAPVANVEGIDLPFPFDNYVGLIVPLRVIARKKWS